MTFFIIIFLVISLIVIWNIFGYSGESRTYIIENEVEYKRAVDAFNDLYKGECYVSFSLDEQWRIKYKHLDDKQKKCSTYFLPKKIRELVNDFKICFNTDENVRKDFNNEFVEKEKILNKDSFDSLLEYSLNDQQRDAILHDEDNSLIIAGAGTGKTTAIMGKIGYLLEKGLATEEEILLIAFGKDAAIDMRKKWSKLKLKKNKINDVKIKTFHALGYDIIGEIEGDKHMLAFGGPPNSEKEAKEFLTNKLYDKDLDKSIRVLVASFFLYHLFPEPEVESFATLDEYISYVKSIKLITFQGEIVKSYEELQIANFLYLNNIKYAYEKVFDENIKNAKFTAYKPDFYLTDYGITIEHFGIDEKGRVPKYFSSENAIDASAKYRAKMDYARKIHSEYGRVLIETYSYESKGDSLLPKLNEKLKNNGVVMKQRSLEDILSKIEVSKTFQPFINLMYTFIVLAKSNDVSADFLKKATGKNASKRVKTFIEIFGYLFNEYESYLKKQGEIDFSDMINLAKEHVLSDKYKHRYKYILVDEFQDMSIGRYKFLKALIGKSGETKLFCVGDDWQSIYRFSGSDLSITTTFSKYFGYTHKAQLELTHRFNNKILDYTSTFIQKNPTQIKKNLKTSSIVADDYNALDIRTYEAGWNVKAAQSEVFRDVLEEIKDLIQSKPKPGKKPKVLILGRYNFDSPKNLKRLQNEYLKYFILDFKTAHRSKGKTYAYTILVDVNAGLLGFPSEIEDDPLLQLVLHKGDGFKNAEERRLFYVALTRAINANYIITQKGNESKFVKELQKTESDSLRQEIKNECPQCHGELIERTGPYSTFYGCKNYPLCEYREKIVV